MRKNKRKKNRLLFYLFLTLVFVFSFTLTRILLKSNEVPACANSKSCTSDLSIKIENNAVGTFRGKKVYPPIVDPLEKEAKYVLGTAIEPGEKHIYVDLSSQTLVAYQGKVEVLRTPVSTGKWGRTPTGNFHIWYKVLSTRMKGGQGADAYDLPNVQYAMFFYRDFGLHTAYWHNNFGHPMSHGCVNMRKIDAKVLYDWADGPTKNILGTTVSICDQITKDNQCIQNNPIL
jgi:lipoprotein-anchoring transpeptidase ErfK/SrfK